MMRILVALLFLSLLLTACGGGDSGQSTAPPAPPPVAQPPDPMEAVAKSWNEVSLQAIRNDFARPTVHARNLFHLSAAMYDAWAAFASLESPYLLGRTINGFACPLNNLGTPADVAAARDQAISFAAFRLIEHRFADSPGAAETIPAARALIQQLGYDSANTSIDYAQGSPAALGNYIADCYIRYGMQDGANEQNDYANIHYQSVNPLLAPRDPGNRDIIDLDRWQGISVPLFIDQSGNEITDQPEFLSPEWGSVLPFALSDSDKTTYQRDGNNYQVYHDPGPPPSHAGPQSDQYKWGFTLVSIWGAQLASDDPEMIDISPASIGNLSSYPQQLSDYADFYNYLEGGDGSPGHAFNPVTGAAYEPQMVRRGDYARVLAEFWADGPDSETPPGHWYVILNEISEHSALDRRFGGTGPELEPLEWHVKAYFALGGAMHDAAVAAWGIKGWYDYIRPVSAIRAMSDRGQSSDPALPSYSPDGLPLVSGYIEMVNAGDALAGLSNQHVGKVKVFSWLGPRFIADPSTDEAGVGWQLAEDWWPYQRPSFVTPPFAGYVSGHSVFSRAAAEILTGFTGNAFFPGGLSGFEVTANEFLVFEEGPSASMTLEWATYRDAADQCSLSRIWGGIHPPADDIPGRLIGEQVGLDAFAKASSFFAGNP